MKRLMIAAALACACVFGANAAQAADAAKAPFGVVNMTKLYTDSKAGKDAMAWLDSLQKDAFAKMEAMQADLTKAQEAKDQATADRLQVEVQALAYALQNTLTKEQERVVGIVTSSLTEILEKYRADNGLAAVFSAESLQVFDPKLDITNAVMAVYDKKTLDFGQKPSLELPPSGTPLTSTPAPAPAAQPAK